MLASFALAAALAVAAPPQDAFRANVRPTAPQPAEHQLQRFHLPPGFQVDLVAAEPEIYKPMNLAFDAAGRLWVSESLEYPYAAKEGEGRDRIQVFEDTNRDGRFDKRTTFVDNLNIPIGLLPYRDGVIAYSIPNIYFFRDTDGDRRCDKRQVLYGPLGQPRDTHGMQNAFRRGYDGWIYVCHGFSNTSTIKGQDGSSITLQSGNTYRIRPDGSRVEQFTWGQVNPFGSTFTPWGDLITADCHSKPLTLLVRGGYYSSFGKPHDGIGFIPPMMEHLHGSTGIAGAAFCSGDNFPESYHGQLFVGNVVTSRVNRDSLRWTGSTARAVEEDDFIRCDDPWFRPVDLRFGPDGALYVADFYNRIIGHYEVPLDHPGRDRHRGRIWRVRYAGEGKETAATLPTTPDLRSSELSALIESLADSNLVTAKLALDEISDRVGLAAVNPLRATATKSQNPRQRALALWALHRLKAIDDSLLQSAFASDSEELRGHVLRMIAETKTLTAAKQEILEAGLRDKSSRVRRFAADAVAQHDWIDSIKPLLDCLLDGEAGDTYLRRGLQIAIRNQLRRGRGFSTAAVRNAAPDARRELALVSLAVPTSEAAAFLLGEAKANRLPDSHRLQCLSHMTAHLESSRLMDDAIELLRQQPLEAEFEQSLLLSFRQKLAARGRTPSPSLLAWAESAAARWLDGKQVVDDWRVVQGDDCWDIERRDCEDGQRNVPFLSSLPGGERSQSVLRSRPFALPERLSFYLCGHLGHPSKPPADNCYVILRLKNGRELARAKPPRNDRARKVVWDFAEHQGKQVQLEVVDQNGEPSYAWLAVSRFEPNVLRVPEIGRRERAQRIAVAAEIAGAYQLTKLVEPLRRLTFATGTPRQVRNATATALTRLRNDSIGAACVAMAALPGASEAWRTKLLRAVAAEQDYPPLIKEWMQAANRPMQRNTAVALASSKAGAELLMRLIDEGVASPRLLQQRAVAQRLEAIAPTYREEIVRRTALLPPLSQQVQGQIAATITHFRQHSNPSVQRGRQLFEKNCQACHQVGGKGELIGPQLDGIGSRGLARITEDLLDPNRNVDAQFRASTMVLDDGRIVSGLVRRREGDLLILANDQGKEVSIPVDSIEEQQKTVNSLMPTNLTETMKPAELSDLLSYLTSLTAEGKAAP